VKNLPPDDEQIEIARRVNAKLAPVASVSFYRIDPEEPGKAFLTGIVFACGSKRALVRRLEPVTQYDEPELIAAVEQWMNKRPGESDRWSSDPSYAAGVDWRTVA
jgi:hypothetical protein